MWSCNSGEPFNREHIIGKHVAKAIGAPFPVPMRWGDYERSTKRRIQHGEITQKELEVVLANRVCRRCNGGWMKKLDRLVLDFMWHALRDGARVHLKDTKQRILARWATKVALLLALWFYDEPLPQPDPEPLLSYAPADNFAALYKRQTPPSGTQIWIGARGADAPEFFVQPTAIYTPPQDAVGYHIVFSLRQLLFFVSGWDLSYDRPAMDWPNPERILPRSSMRRIWPIRERVVEWPPTPRVETGNLHRLLNP